jgi:hypothetical protein
MFSEKNDERINNVEANYLPPGFRSTHHMEILARIDVANVD